MFALIDYIAFTYLLYILAIHQFRDLRDKLIYISISVIAYFLLRMWLDGFQGDVTILAAIAFHFVRLPREVQETDHESDFEGFLLDFAGICEKNSRDIQGLLEVFHDLHEFLGTIDAKTKTVMETRDIEKDTKSHIELLSRPPSRAIIVIGEVSAGKSSVINKLLRRDVLPESFLHETKTICQIYDSNQRMIVPYRKSADNQLEQAETVYATTDANLKQELKQLQNREEFELIKIYVPNNFLKNPLFIVDTPGFGESERFDERLMKYIPEAAGFIFVIDAGHAAGGISNRGLEHVIRTVNERHSKVGMLPFDPKCAVFIYNQWDKVPWTDKEKVREKNNGKLSTIWPGFNPEQAVCFNALSKDADQRKCLQDKIDPMVRSSLTSRFDTYKSWMQSFLTEVINTAQSLSYNANLKPEKRQENVQTITVNLEAMDKMLAEYINSIDNKAEEWIDSKKTYLLKTLFPENLQTRYDKYGLSRENLQIDNGEEIEIVRNFIGIMQNDIFKCIQESFESPEFVEFFGEMRKTQTVLLNKLQEIDRVLTHAEYPVKAILPSIEPPCINMDTALPISESINQLWRSIKQSFTRRKRSRQSLIDCLVDHYESENFEPTIKSAMKENINVNSGPYFVTAMRDAITRRHKIISNISEMDIIVIDRHIFENTCSAAQRIRRKLDICGRG